MKLAYNNDNTVLVRDMKDGQVGIIVSCNYLPNVGKIVQRHGDTLITLQAPIGQSWNHVGQPDDFRVRILKRGEQIVIE